MPEKSGQVRVSYKRVTEPKKSFPHSVEVYPDVWLSLAVRAEKYRYRKGVNTMVSIFQRICWLVVTVVLALGLPLVANAGWINTQLLNTDTTLANAIFENAFTDSVTEGYRCEYAMDLNLLAVIQSRLDCILPRTEENQPVSFPYLSTGRVKLDLRSIATNYQQRWEWSTYPSGSDSAARYQRLTTAQTSSGNVCFNRGLG